MKAQIAVLLVAVAGSGMAQDATQLEGKKMPKISLTLLDGGKLSTAALRGKVVILDFWATWCVPCVAASPTMEKLYEKYKNRGLIVIGANLLEKTSRVADYKRAHHYSYPFAVDDAEVAHTLNVNTAPVFMFIDRRGIVRRVDSGFAGNSPASWEATVKQLLAG